MTEFTPSEICALAAQIDKRDGVTLIEHLQTLHERQLDEDRVGDRGNPTTMCNGCQTPVSAGEAVLSVDGEPMHPGCRASARDAVDGRGVRGRREMQEVAE